MVAASAPAKVILFGEHAVVYGQPAIAVPVSSLRVTATVEYRVRDGLGVKVISPELSQNLSSEIVQDKVDTALNVVITRTLEALNLDSPDITISLYSEIPIASGLGSGASVSTAVARAIGLTVDRPFDTSVLNSLVFEVEKLHHGTPSGIDNTVIVYEKPVYFVRESPVETLLIPTSFHLIIADSGYGALTRIAVGDVRKLYEAEPTRIQLIFDQIGEIARQARKYIEAGSPNLLGTLMRENHELLQELTVSSPELDRLVSAANNAGALGAKLSGGGRGGNMIALVTAETQKAVRKALLDTGAARVFSTVVGDAHIH